MKDQKGITLIALVITIIVMLILVAVTIVFAVNGGLFSKANTASDQTRLAQINEAIALAKSDLYADYYDPTNTAGTVDGSATNGVLVRYHNSSNKTIAEIGAELEARINLYLDSSNQADTNKKLEVDYDTTHSGNSSNASGGYVFKFTQVTPGAKLPDGATLNSIEVDFLRAE